jgi:hypothetical protein
MPQMLLVATGSSAPTRTVTRAVALLPLLSSSSQLPSEFAPVINTRKSAGRSSGSHPRSQSYEVTDLESKPGCLAYQHCI